MMRDGLICGYLLRQINFVWERIAKEILRDSDLNWTQAAVLGLLINSENRELSLKELEKSLSLTQSVVARSVTQMVHLGYLEYVLNSDDKRVKRVHILDKGIESHRALFSHIDETEAPLLAGMSDGEKLMFKELLKKALENTLMMQEKIKEPK